MKNRRVIAITFSPDGKRVAQAGLDAVATIRDVESGKVLVQCEGHTGRIESLAFSPDGQRLVTGSIDNTLRVWDATTGTELVRFSRDVMRPMAIAFSQDGRQLASGGYDNTVTLRSIMPWRSNEYPGAASDPIENRFEEYKREQWAQQTAPKP